MGLEDIDKEHKNLVNLLNVLANRIVLKSEVSEVKAVNNLSRSRPSTLKTRIKSGVPIYHKETP